MKQGNKIPGRIYPREEIVRQVRRWRLLNKRIAFTNGVFDILHEGHLKILSQAASLADILVVGVNSDASVKRLKGDARPVNTESSRQLVLASLLVVDAVTLFDEDTPLELIRLIVPDVLVKGGDYTVETMVGAKEVMAAGGTVEIIPLEAGFSTTLIIERVRTTTP